MGSRFDIGSYPLFSASFACHLKLQSANELNYTLKRPRRENTSPRKSAEIVSNLKVTGHFRLRRSPHAINGFGFSCSLREQPATDSRNE
jgi:hypothetical protein